MKQALRLSQAVLASTLFIVPGIAWSDLTVNNSNSVDNKVYTTGVPENFENITIANNGFIRTTLLGTNNGDGILVNSENAFITLAPNNLTAAGGISAVRNGITITAGDNAQIFVGSGTSKISATSSGIFVDSASVNVDNAGSIIGSPGIQVTANGSNFVLANELTGSVTDNALSNAIALNGASGTINNFGIISGTGGIQVGGQNATITNNLSSSATTGVIQGNLSPGIQVNGTGLSLTNSGVITSASSDGLQLNQDFLSVNNNNDGIISSNTGNGIRITAASTSNNGIINAGLITSNGNAAAGISIEGNYTGSITNTGTIRNTNIGGVGLSPDAITIKAAFTTITNSGTISAVGTGNAIGSQAGSSTGTINNSNIIQAENVSAIFLGGSLTQINNTGTINTTTPIGGASTIVVANDNVTLSGGIVNSGNILNGAGGVGAQVIDLQAGKVGVNVKLTQNAGLINGSVLLASNGGSIFDINAGTINGDVITAAAVSSTLNLNGGVINGNVNLLGVAGDTVNLVGSTVDDINGGPGPDTINLSGGTFDNITGGLGIDTLNVLNTVSTTGDITGVELVNAKVGTFTVNNKLTGFTNLSVGPSASMVVNSNNVTGLAAAVTINNASTLLVNSDRQLDTGGGTITVNNGGSLSLGNSTVTPGALANTYTQLAGGNYQVTIQGPGDFGKMSLTGAANLNAGSFVTAQLGTGQFIPTGTQFDIISSVAGPINDASTLNQPYSLTVQFNKATVAGNILRLTAARNNFSNFATTDPSQGVAGALDAISKLPANQINAQILAVLGQLDLIGNQATLVEELESLAPPVNYALIKASRVSMDQMFRSITRRIEDMRNLRTLGAESYMIIGPANMDDRPSGYNYGDSVYSAANQGAWVQGYGAILDQHKRNQVDGYLGDAAGVAMGMDWGRQGALVGAALNFTQVHMVGRTTDENVQNLQSVQGSVYSWLDLTDAIYLDTQFGFASNHYKTRRNIGVGTVTTAGFSDFFGVNYGAQAEMGYAFLYDFLTVAPVARLRYTRMALDDYSENGAGGLSLTVNQQGLNEGIAGIGLRMLGKKEFAQAVYAPEVSVMLAYDFYADEQSVQSRFLGGGPLFTTTGIKPPHKMLLVDAGVNVHTYDAYIFTVKGELELRDHYYGYSGWVQLYRSW